MTAEVFLKAILTPLSLSLSLSVLVYFIIIINAHFVVVVGVSL